MTDKLIQSQQRLREGLYDLYEIGGFELFLAGTRGLKRDLIIDLETSALTPARGEIIHYRARNRWDEGNLLEEYEQHPRSNLYLKRQGMEQQKKTSDL